MNLFALSNVSLHPKITTELAKKGVEIQNPPSDMHRVVMHLAMENPLWQFVVVTKNNSDQALEFEVKQSGEVIGKIERSYYRGGYKIAIANDRISAKRERTSSYRTDNPEKAILMAKKMFYPLNTTERVDKAVSLASQVINNQEYEKRREYQWAEREVGNYAQAFIMEDGFHLFIEHVNKLPDNKSLPIRKKMEEAKRLKTDMLTIESVREKFDKHKSALVIKDQGNYMVKIGVDVQVYDDNTLPENLRGRLGMLKLVDKEHFISDVGCRISDEVFVVITEEA